RPGEHRRHRSRLLPGHRARLRRRRRGRDAHRQGDPARRAGSHRCQLPPALRPAALRGRVEHRRHRRAEASLARLERRRDRGSQGAGRRRRRLHLVAAVRPRRLEHAVAGAERLRVPRRALPSAPEHCRQATDRGGGRLQAAGKGRSGGGDPMKKIVMLLSLASLCGGAALASTYTNPVIAPVAADPSLIRAPDGTWYLYATQDRWDDGVEHYLPIFRSADLVTWEFVGDVFVFPPRWKSQGFLWAPDISLVGDTYHLYYSYSTWGDPNPCIGLATSRTPEGPWEDLGRPVFCSDDIGVRNSIDPYHHVAADGSRTLIWGSFNGIYATALNPEGTDAVGEITRLADSRFEAAYIHEREGAYYLFLSVGSCCEGASSTYTTWVG